MATSLGMLAASGGGHAPGDGDDEDTIARYLHETVVRALIDCADSPIVVHDGRRVLHANRAARRLIAGEERVELAERAVSELWRPEPAGNRVRLCLRADRAITTTAVSVPVLLDPDWSVATFLTDPDEISVPLDRLAALDRVHGATILAAGLAHEVAGPVAAIRISLAAAREEVTRLRGGGSSLSSPLMAMEVLADCLEVASIGADAVASVVRDHQWSTQARETGLGGGTCDPRLAVERAVRMARPRLGGAAWLSVQLDDVGTVPASAGHLTQIALNLLNNAADAVSATAGSRGRIEVRLRREEGRAVLEVQDDGPGIPPEVIAGLFEPYVTTKLGGPSQGLGLPICRALARRWGGEISAASVPGQGSTFRLSLPLEAAARPAPPM